MRAAAAEARAQQSHQVFQVFSTGHAKRTTLGLGRGKSLEQEAGKEALMPPGLTTAFESSISLRLLSRRWLLARSSWIKRPGNALCAGFVHANHDWFVSWSFALPVELPSVVSHHSTGRFALSALLHDRSALVRTAAMRGLARFVSMSGCATAAITGASSTKTLPNCRHHKLVYLCLFTP